MTLTPEQIEQIEAIANQDKPAEQIMGELNALPEPLRSAAFEYLDRYFWGDTAEQ